MQRIIWHVTLPALRYASWLEYHLAISRSGILIAETALECRFISGMVIHLLHDFRPGTFNGGLDSVDLFLHGYALMLGIASDINKLTL